MPETGLRGGFSRHQWYVEVAVKHNGASQEHPRG